MPSSPRRSSAGVVVAIAVVVVAVLIVLALLLTGVLPGLKSPGGGGGGSGGATNYVVTFTESGLLSGAVWTVDLGSSSHSGTASSLAFAEPNGTYSFSVNATAFAASPGSGSVTVAGSNVVESVAFHPYAPGVHFLNFTETGLPSGTNWSVDVNGTASSSTSSVVTFVVPSGTYRYTVANVTGYAATPRTGQVAVSGSDVQVTVTFGPSGAGASTFPLTFVESGLPVNDYWEVDCTTPGGLYFGQGGTASSTEFAIPNGTYSCQAFAQTYVPAVPTTNLTVAGQPLTVPFTFVPTYQVNFTESGLEIGTLWWVFLNGSEHFDYPQSSSGTVSFLAPNGTFPFAVGAYGYSAAPASGTVTVAGGPTNRAIVFTPWPTYNVTFTESGLPSGGLWYADLNNSTLRAAPGSPIVFGVSNGTYPFSVESGGVDFGANASPASGDITVAGANVTQAIVYTPFPTYFLNFTESGLPTGKLWNVTVDGAGFTQAAPTNLSTSAPSGVNTFSVDAYGYRATPSSGNVTVPSAPVTVSVVFTPSPPPPPPPPAPTYNVTFSETGLPMGSTWYVSVFEMTTGDGCVNETATGPASWVCAVPNGTYSWTAESTVEYYTGDPGTGWVVVNGQAQTVAVGFTNSSGECYVDFEAEPFYLGPGGLPNGARWSVTMAGTTRVSEGTDVGFLIPDGTATNYTVVPPSGYVSLPSSGSLSCVGTPYQQTELGYFSTGYVAVAFSPTGGAPLVALPSVGDLGSSSGTFGSAPVATTTPWIRW